MEDILSFCFEQTLWGIGTSSTSLSRLFERANGKNWEKTIKLLSNSIYPKRIQKHTRSTLLANRCQLSKRSRDSSIDSPSSSSALLKTSSEATSVSIIASSIGFNSFNISSIFWQLFRTGSESKPSRDDKHRKDDILWRRALHNETSITPALEGKHQRYQKQSLKLVTDDEAAIPIAIIMPAKYICYCNPVKHAQLKQGGLTNINNS